MSRKDLDTMFLEAVEIASNMTQASLPQDVHLSIDDAKEQYIEIINSLLEK
jgi:hypothetical protein